MRAALLTQILTGLKNPLKFDVELIAGCKQAKITYARAASVNLTANGAVFYILNLEISC